MTSPTRTGRAVVAAIALTLGARSLAAQDARAGATTQGDDRSVRRVLFRLENDWANAVIRRDARALRRLVAPRWVYSDESGVMERDAGIRAFTTGADTVHEASNSGMRAMVYPGTAVVIGTLEMRGRSGTGPFTHRYRYTDTWAFLDGRWRCIASQDYLLPDPQPRR